MLAEGEHKHFAEGVSAGVSEVSEEGQELLLLLEAQPAVGFPLDEGELVQLV